MSQLKGFKYGHLSLIALAILAISLFSWQVVAAPNGATVSPGTPETGGTVTAEGVNASAGNITAMELAGVSNTQAWQGFYGNVTGVIRLADASNNVLYNWTQTSPTGEVYASTNNSITWSGIQCLNFTANGTGGVGDETAGETSRGGINLTTLESQYNIGATDVDGVNETFASTINHDEFLVGSLNFTIGECPATAAYDDTGQSVDGNFEEVLLYEPNTFSVVFASILEQDLTGFNQGTEDFEMLVLEDGHNGDTSTTVYYFFMEIE